jgi:diguanylate cyclase (GGDEF)-like protein
MSFNNTCKPDEQKAVKSIISENIALSDILDNSAIQKLLKSYDSKRLLPLSVIMGDVNGLKLINDGFGRAEGDKVLTQIAKILKDCCKKNDLVCRIGGDEFCILLSQADSKIAQKICEHIYKACEEQNSSDDNIIKLSISLGYAMKTDINDNIESVLKRAEEFMYMHKLLEAKSARSALITLIRTTMFEKSAETEEHSERIAILSKALGIKTGLEEVQINQLELLAVLHDMGKICVDQKILNKRGKLTEDEWMEVKKHPVTGYRIATAMPELVSIADCILSHHEHWDGSGYPQGLEGEAIPFLSRIIAVVDTYDAVTNGRPYKKANSKEYALQIIKKNSGRQFDPKVVEIFLSII